MDGGSTERWEDDGYRKVYASILAGEWEQYDAFDATHRAQSQFDLYRSGVGACSVFRTFQGWVSLSNSGTGRGSLQVVPLLREATAFVILRPFLQDVPPSSFCGANPGKVQDLFPAFHKELLDALVPMPDVRPGDSVWWHCDLIHAVEGSHGGAEDASAYYIPAVPLCARNAAYIRQQASCFLAGRTPPDFPPNHSEASVAGRGSPDDLDQLGRQMMGFDAWPAQPRAGEPLEDFMASNSLRHESAALAA